MYFGGDACGLGAVVAMVSVVAGSCLGQQVKVANRNFVPPVKLWQA